VSPYVYKSLKNGGKTVQNVARYLKIGRFLEKKPFLTQPSTIIF
jgi:hypothetical protein